MVTDDSSSFPICPEKSSLLMTDHDPFFVIRSRQFSRKLEQKQVERIMICQERSSWTSLI